MSRAEVDAILRAVCYRSTVYAREILEPLHDLSLTTPGAGHTYSLLCSAVGTVEGVEYLHQREFIDALLDLRNALPKEDA